MHRKPLAWLARPALTLATLLALTLLLAMPQMARAQPAYPPGGLSDPPGIVARLNLAEGAVSFAPADANPDASAWTPAVLNRPLTTGDRLWSGPSARSELHIGSTAVRMNEQTSLDFVALNEQFTQLWVAQGSVQLRVRTLFEGERLEVDTPNLAFVVLAAGNYRIDVNPASGTTRVVVLSGVGVLYGDSGATLNLANQQQGNFSGTQLMSAPPAPAFQDSFYAWSAARDRREDQSVSARYIPRETIGYLQLDRYGDWQQDASYGAIWLPRAVPANWAPYRNGNWSWISPWGWTWVDDAPWGFAPFHYGRWARIGPRWAWVPGQLPRRPVYAPALVAFIGGGAGLNWNIAAGSGGAPRPGVGWFPLAPGEAFRPVYRASPRYITQVNNNITVNNTVNITNNYRYQRQPAAVTAVGRDDFFKGRPQQQGSLHPLNAAELGRAQLLVERSALPQRPDVRERLRLAPAAALPPAALLVQPVIRSRPERIDPRTARPENHERNPQPQGQALPAQPPAVQLPALRPLVTPLPGRAGEADQRVQREQARQQEVQHHQNEVLQQSQQAEQARQQDQQRRQAEQAQAERIQHEQALQQAEQQRQQGELARQQDAQRRQSQALQQRQRNQQRQQAEQARQQDQQRRQAEQAQAQAERIQQEQALHQAEQSRQQGDLTRQQDAQRRQNEALQQHQQMQIQHEQALQQQQQQQQRAIQQEQRRVQPQQHQRPPPANAADERAPRPEGERRRNQEP